VNLAFGSRLSLLEVIRELETVLGRPLEREFGAPRAGDVRDSQADSSRLRALFPDIAPVDFGDALRRTVEWFGE
jgi:UDP-glucose 4-epimerase